MSDARAFDRFLDENNYLPHYQPSGPYSFESRLELQSTSRKLLSGSDGQGASQRCSTTTDNGEPITEPGTGMRNLCPFLYEILSYSESEVTETSQIEVELGPADREVAALDTVRRQGVVTEVEGPSVLDAGKEEDCFDADQPLTVIYRQHSNKLSSSGILVPTDVSPKDIDNPLPVGGIPGQMIIHPKHSEDDQSMPKAPPVLLFGELGLSEKAINAAPVREDRAEGGGTVEDLGETLCPPDWAGIVDVTRRVAAESSFALAKGNVECTVFLGDALN